jgi:hypothetical protein
MAKAKSVVVNKNPATKKKPVVNVVERLFKVAYLWSMLTMQAIQLMTL